MFTVMGKGARPPAQMVPGKSTGTFHLEPLGHTAKSRGIMDIISQVTSLEPKWVTPLPHYTSLCGGSQDSVGAEKQNTMVPQTIGLVQSFSARQSR